MNQLVNMISMREHFASFVYDVCMCSTHWFQLSTRAVIANTPHKRRWCWWCKAVLGRKGRWAKKATDAPPPSTNKLTTETKASSQHVMHTEVKACCECKYWVNNESIWWWGVPADELLIIYKSCGFCMTSERVGRRRRKGKIDIETCERSDSDKQCTTYVTKSRPASVGWRMSRIICFYLSDFEFSFLSLSLSFAAETKACVSVSSWRWWEWNGTKKIYK